MENLEKKPLDENSFGRNNEINDFLLEAAKWGKFLAIMGYIGLGVGVLVVIFVLSDTSELMAMPGGNASVAGSSIFFILFFLIYLIPINYLYRFSLNIRRGITEDDATAVNYGFQNLKSLFKFMGVFTIIILSIYAIVLLIAIPAMLT